MSRPRLLDCCCGAGGVARGYYNAGFDVVGIDMRPQPRYPFPFIRGDVLELLPWVRGFDVIHVSPPCQAWTDLQKQSKLEYPDLIEPVRGILRELGVPYVIENVEGAPLESPVRLCGASVEFPDLRVIRHRLFESNVPLRGVPCPSRHPLVFTHDKRKAHHGALEQDSSYVQVTGGGNCTVANKRSAMGIDWMTGRELNEAIPPAYTRWIGTQLRVALCGA
jgi:DNA (cytosine-5)-methyltransferase 1